MTQSAELRHQVGEIREQNVESSCDIVDLRQSLCVYNIQHRELVWLLRAEPPPQKKQHNSPKVENIARKCHDK